MGEAQLASGFGWSRSGNARGRAARECQSPAGLLKGESCPQLTSGDADYSPAQGRVKRAQTFKLEGAGLLAGRRGAGTSSTTDGRSGEDDLGHDAGEFCGPARFFLAGEFGQVGESLVDGRVFLAQDGQDRTTEAIAGEALVVVRGVFTPGLVALGKKATQIVAASGEQRPQDRAGRKPDDGRDAGQALKPGAAEKLHQDGLRLVVEGVGGEDVSGGAVGEELAEALVTEGAGGLFEGLAVGAGAGFGVNAEGVEGKVELVAESLDEGLVGVGLLAAQGVIDVDGGETDAESLAGERVGGVNEQQQGG